MATEGFSNIRRHEPRWGLWRKTLQCDQVSTAHGRQDVPDRRKAEAWSWRVASPGWPPAEQEEGTRQTHMNKEGFTQTALASLFALKTIQCAQSTHCWPI